MGNNRNRKRKAVRTPPSKKAKIPKHGDVGGEDDVSQGASGVKIGNQSAKFGVSSTPIETTREGTIFIDLSLLFGVFDELLKCPECDGCVTSHVDIKKKNGFSHYIVLQCNNENCSWKYCFNSSKKQGYSYETNVRTVLAFREIGRGHAAMVTFCKIMNMPAPPTRRVFTKVQNKKLLPAVKELANDSMVTNAMKVKEINDNGECGISMDGTWQKRGHASHNGIVTAISLDTKKCLDVEVLSDKCQQCLKWEKKQSHPKYHEWKASHICKINHEGSANSMETAGGIKIFERSVNTRGLKYTSMLGDGDSSTHNSIVQSKPYGEECTPDKMECIGHVQKRVGSRLRRLKNANKGVKLSDGKGLSGKGRLTTGKIDILQNYYGLAVRNNLNDVSEMAKQINAALFHVASTNEKPQHHLCPTGDDSWCGYQRDKETYKHRNGIPDCIVKLIEPIFVDLSNPSLLQKCTHGLTQNVNECLNGLIWERCPKTTYVEQETVALATYLAVLKFNDGDIYLLKTLTELDIVPGIFTSKGAHNCDRDRINLSAKMSTEKVKKSRKVRRHLRKSYIDDAKDKEGVTYEAGNF
jgi:hypothetical protein